MRLKSILAGLTAMAALAMAAPMPAKAFGLHESQYRVGSPDDPYAYVPRKPGYYPYYGSGYWRPIEERRHAYRYKFAIPPYAKAWGWNSREWYLAQKHDRRWHAHR